MCMHSNFKRVPNVVLSGICLCKNYGLGIKAQWVLSFVWICWSISSPCCFGLFFAILWINHKLILHFHHMTYIQWHTTRLFLWKADHLRSYSPEEEYKTPISEEDPTLFYASGLCYCCLGLFVCLLVVCLFLCSCS